MKILSQTPWKHLLPLILGVLASVAIFLLWQRLEVNEKLQLQRLIQKEAEGIELQLSKELTTRILTLKQMASRWQVSGGTPKQFWEADAQAYINHFSGYEGIEWVDPNFIVRWVVPNNNNTTLNLDLKQEHRRQITLKIARDLNQIILTRRINFIHGGEGFLATVPLFVNNRFDGFILGVFEFQTLFESILRVSPAYKLAIYDGTQLIYSQAELPAATGLEATVMVKAYGADWRVVVFPTSGLIQEAKSASPMVILTGGLFLVWLSVLVIYLVQISQFQIDQLQKTNHQLQREIYQRQETEIALNQLAAIVESSEDAIISKNLEGIITSWNQGAEMVFGYTALEMLGKSIRTLIPPQDQDEEKEILQRIFQGEHIKHYDTKRLRKDGTIIDVSLSLSPIKDKMGTVIGAAKIARDITKQKQGEAALQKSESSYRELINNLSIGFIIHGVDTRILVCNSIACELLGLSMDQMMGKTAIDPAWHFLREDGTPMTLEEYPVYRVLSTQKPFKDYILGINRVNLSRVWVLVNAFCEFDSNHQLKQVVIMFVNITPLKEAENKIQQTRNFLQALLNHLPVAVFVKNMQPERFGAFQFWNKTSEQLFGISAEDAIGKTVYDLFPREQAEFFDQKDRTVLETGNKEDIPEEVVSSLSLGKRWLHTIKIPIYDEQHQPQYLLCFSEDITDKKQVEAERQELSAVMENAVSGISKIDVQGRYIYANKNYAQITGYQPEEMIGMSWEKTVHPDELEKLIAIYWQMVKEGRVEVETIGVRKDGSIFYKQLVMISTYDEQHQLLGHYCFMKDISEKAKLEAERRKAELQLEKELLRTKTLFNTSMDGIVVMNHQGNVLQASPGFAQMLGYTLEETLSLNLVDWDAQWTKEELQAIMSSDSLMPLFETQHRRKDGSKYDVEISYSRVILDGEILHFCICRDISDRKQKEIALTRAVEAAEQANLAKSIFLANMSHELRTPLNVILGFAQVMAHDPALTANLQEDLQTIRRSGDHLLSLINDVLDLSKIESGHCTLEETDFDLINLLHSLRNMLAERASSKGLELSFNINPDVPQWIKTDAQKLRQVLINLLGNAIKFTHQGGITLEVRHLLGETELPHQSMIEFAVIDTGVGIAPEELDYIFDAFIQAKAGKQMVSGTGLGLTISRKLLQLMGGDISVRSTIGEGTTFSFRLRVTLSDDLQVIPEQGDRLILGLAPGHAHHRILVVDDREENRLLLVRLLTQLGLEVKEASNGLEAVQLWREWQPDLTWMDIRMPVLDGYEATKQIRAVEKGKSSIIIALTAQASQSDRTLALAAGCNDYMSKPFLEQVLFEKMAQYLGLEYLYGEPVAHETTPTVSKTLTSADLKIMSPNWINQVHEAALDLNDHQIFQLIAEIPPEHKFLIETMTSLVDNFQLEAIAILTNI
ncbi:PAS domain S-box protein [Planktothrix paucivesiculata]|uniref:Circadian input-output histidine kinase CikA n=1 Tax=Planktothrix paucivesiculata PCC 9631 TaxID=671071 RepID=A0A7Z9E2B7_9CYAN|nr:PAS domain S-box protein [Planktothrix paucivesiculata]VXD23772.1 putative Histidine kinase [Planktothrix paucivesiculata PCC 9631]